MTTKALIRTKFQRPTIGPDILPRPHLIERLENGRFCKLTLISAPAGYGKSVLASAWQEEYACLGAWLSLDTNDNDLNVFLNYFITAIETAFAESFSETRDILDGLQLPPLDSLAASLVNETAALPQPLMLVLDDYHLIINQEINQLVDSFIQYQPGHMHLVLVSRQDPSLDIVNLRAKNQVAEIRLAELRFSEEEGQQYLERNLGDSVPADLAHKLLQRTEGWAAGLRLAVLALRGQADQDRFLETFQGTNQHVMSYLIGEVLSQQSPAVQTFLLQTSLLDRFCAPLCEAFLAEENRSQHNGDQEILDRLLQDNLFLIPLDLKGEWFRYHHLFQDLLRYRLKKVTPEEEVSQLHLRATVWLADHGFIEEALDHAFRADDMDRAAQIVAQARYELMNEAQWQLLERLLRRFPREVLDRYPDLLMAETWIYYHHNQYTKLPAALGQLDKVIKNGSMMVGEKDHLLGEIASLRSLLSYFTADAAGAMLQAEEALRLTHPDLWIVRIFARMMLAGAQQMTGDLHNAYANVFHSFDDETVQSNALKATVLATACNIAWIAADLDNLQQYASQVISLSQNARSSEIAGLGHSHLGKVAYHQNDLSAAEEHFSLVNQHPYRNYCDGFVASACGLALTYQALGQEEDAREVVDAAHAFLIMTGNTQLLFEMKALQADLALRQGHLSIASRWAERLEPVPPLSPITRIYAPHMTLVKVWLAENTPSSRRKAAGLLTQLREFLGSIHNRTFLIETMALQSILCQLEGDEQAALYTLEEALVLALPSGIIRLFVDLGPPMGNLLAKLPEKEPELAAYKEKILTAAGPLTGQQHSVLQDEEGSQSDIEPLTNRELDVLLLLSQRQTDREIANYLHISHHTVRSHTRNIYAKLGVNNRRQAASRAEELGLI